MKRFLFCATILITTLVVGCGGGSSDDYGKECENNIDVYYCNYNYSSSHYRCQKGKSKYYSGYNPNTGEYEYFSDAETIYCHSEKCDNNTGKCVAACGAGQYRCDDYGYIYSCDSNGQWDFLSNEYCAHGCAKEISTSIIELCATEESEE